MSQPSRSSSLSSPAGPSSRATPSLDTTAAGTTPTTEWNLDGSPASLSFAANSTSTGSLSPFIHNRTFAAHSTLNSTLGISTQAASSPIQRQRGMSQQNGNGNGNGTLGLGLGKKPSVDTEPPSPSPLSAPSHGSAPSPSPSPSPSHHPLLKNLSTGSLSSKSDSSTTSDHAVIPASATGSGQTGLVNGRGRLLIVANRLPLSMKRSGENKEISFTPSSGGLVSALKGVKGTQMQWIGWPGAEVSSKKDQEVVKAQLKQHNALPVFLSQETCDLFYNGFCNNILWPLFHYIPLPIESLQLADAQFSAYEQANSKFAKVVLENYRDGDTVWVHDYHLMLLPAMLRQSQPHMKIGFFLHTPFPSSEIFRVLPSRKELLLGVLASDLIGFHTHDYARHFQSSCVRFVGAASTGDIIKAEGLNSHLGTFPIGIDPQSFLKALETTQVHNFQKDLEQKFGGKKVLLGIDRLDYIKGIPHKLYAFERFFEQNPDWIGKCVLVQIAIPSRTDVPEYQKLRSQTHELVGRVNGKFGSLDSVPIHYLDQSIPFDKMCALYRVSDVMVISSVRDGMNLVAYEYIACQKDRAGVLILSEFAGAGQSLGAGALSVNPWSITDLADAIKTALTMPMSERRERNAYAFKHVLTHTAQHWAETFVNALHATSGPASPVCDNEPLSIPPPLNFETVVTAFQSSKHRLIVAGLAGTLTENQKPEESFKEFERHVKASAKMQAAIKLLSQDPNTTLLVLTSRSRLMCDSVLGDTEAWQAAENGYFLRKGGKDQPWLMMHENLDLSWKEGVHRVFEYFTDRTPRTYIKDQETHMSWHYADAEPTFAKRQANDMISHLTGGPLSNTSTEVLDSSNIIQVRPLGVSKGIAIKQILNELNTWGKQKAYAWAENDKNPEFHAYPVAPNYVEDEMEEKETYHSSSINNLKNTNLSVNSLTNSPKVRRCSSSVSLRDLSRGASGQHAHSHAHAHHDSIWSTESDAHHGAHNSTHANRLLSQKRSHKLPPVDFVLCIGNFLDRDEDLFAVLNERAVQGHGGSPALGRNSRTGSRMTTPTPSSHTIASPSPSPDDDITLPQSVKHKEPSPSTSVTNSPLSPATSIVALHATSTTSTKAAHIFTCSVGEKPSHAQFFVPSVAQVETLLTQLAATLPSQNNNRLGLTLPTSAASITPTIQSPTPAPIQAVIPTGAH